MPGDDIVLSTFNSQDAMTNTMHILDHALQHPFKKPPAAVFDVDETLLNNHDTIDDYFKINPSGKILFQYAEKKNLPIFIVTARRKSTWSVKFLKAQLERLGYNTSKIEGVYMVPREYDHLNDGGSAYKQVARKHIARTHTILFTAGDRWGDVCNHNNSKTNRKHAKLNSKMYHTMIPVEAHTYLGIKFI